METIFERLAQSSDVIFVLGIVITGLVKFLLSTLKTAKEDRIKFEEKLEKLNEEKAEEIKAMRDKAEEKMEKMNVYVREHDVSYLGSIDKLCDALERMKLK